MDFGKILKFRRRKNLKIKYLNKLIKKKIFSKFEKYQYQILFLLEKTLTFSFIKLKRIKKLSYIYLKKINIFSITEEIKIIVFWCQKI